MFPRPTTGVRFTDVDPLDPTLAAILLVVAAILAAIHLAQGSLRSLLSWAVVIGFAVLAWNAIAALE